MGEWERRLRRAKTWWNGLTPSARISLGAVAAGLLVAVVTLVALNTEPTMGVLFSKLSEDDSARIVERLSTMGVPHRFDDESATVLVPKSRVHEIRLTLASEGLPSGSGVGFEVFDQQRFGESEFSEQVKYHRALEGELGRTISHLSGVRRARVHLVLPKRSLFVTKGQNASASVALHLKPGWKMRDEQARGIIHLVASSVRGLEPSKVTLVDGQGRRLGGSEQVEGQLAADALTFRREIERAKEQAADQILAATLGPGRSVVRVAAEVDFTREERTEETFDPEGIAARSFQILEEGVGDRGKTVSGLPGAISNLPGGEQPGPGGGAGKAGLTRRSETRNFEVSKVLKKVAEPVGRVVRLQVAVVVDGSWSGEGEERDFTPMPKKERDQIKAIVATAVGIDEQRGDKVTVESLPFAEPARRELSWLEQLLGPYYDDLPTLLAIILIGLALLMLRRRWKKSALLTADSREALPASLQVKELGEAAATDLRGKLAAGAEGADPALPAPEGADTGTQALSPGAEAGAAEKELPEPTPDKMEEIRQLASELAGQEPEAAARVIRGWLAEDAK